MEQERARSDRKSGWYGYAPTSASSPADPWGKDWLPAEAGDGPLNAFSLVRYHVVDGTPDGGAVLVVPVIDGVPLFEFLRGDRWPGVPEAWLESPEEWLGSPSHVEYGRTIVLDGGCGVAGCCGVMGRISILERTVVWDRFTAGGAPSLPAGLRFEFARGEYEGALESFMGQPVLDWEDSCADD